MVYDESLASRIRAALGADDRVTERKMFGGLAFLQDGKMFCGIVKDDLMVRVGPERYKEALARTGARPMDFTGRPMTGYVFVGPRGCNSSKAVASWVRWSAEFVSTLKTKPKRKRSKPKPPRRSSRSRKK